MRYNCVLTFEASEVSPCGAYASPPGSQRVWSVPIAGSDDGSAPGTPTPRSSNSAGGIDSNASETNDAGDSGRHGLLQQQLQETLHSDHQGGGVDGFDLAAMVDGGADAEALLSLAHQLCRSLQLEPTAMRVHIETSRTSSGAAAGKPQTFLSRSRFLNYASETAARQTNSQAERFNFQQFTG